MGDYSISSHISFLRSNRPMHQPLLGPIPHDQFGLALGIGGRIHLTSQLWALINKTAMDSTDTKWIRGIASGISQKLILPILAW